MKKSANFIWHYLLRKFKRIGRFNLKKLWPSQNIWTLAFTIITKHLIVFFFNFMIDLTWVLQRSKPYDRIFNKVVVICFFTYLQPWSHPFLLLHAQNQCPLQVLTYLIKMGYFYVGNWLKKQANLPPFSNKFFRYLTT